MKCLYICIVTVTVISAAVPKDICETCVPTQDCPLFEKLKYEDQLIWMEKFPCGSLPKTNNFHVPAGFSSAAKGDNVCCSNNIWGIEKPERFGPQIGHQSGYNDKTFSNNLDNYLNKDEYSRNNFNTNDASDASPIYFPDWDQEYGNKILTNGPANTNYHYINNNNETNRPNEYNSYYHNNHNLNHRPDSDNSNAVNNHENNVYEINNGNSTIWLPNRTQNYDNTNYWLTHDPGNSNYDTSHKIYWNNRSGPDWHVRSTEKPSDNYLFTKNLTKPNPIFYNPKNTARPFYRDHVPGGIEKLPITRYPFEHLPINNPTVNLPRPPFQIYPRDNISRFPIRYTPPENMPRFPVQYNPPENINRPNQFMPRDNTPSLPIPPPRNNNVLPRQPFVNNSPRWPYYNDRGRRSDNSFETNAPYYSYTQPPFDGRYQGNFGGGQCARLTSFPPDPQSDCCGRQLADEDRITGRPPQYMQPAFTNHWERAPFISSPIWNTRDEVPINSTDVEVTIERRISGGHATELYQYPWTVLLLTTFNYGNREAAFNCGGSLISARYVLTAGHCVYEKGSTVKSIQVNLAEYDKRTFPKDCKATRYGRKCIENIVMYAEQIITHPQYENENLLNDIALIRLQGTAPYTDYIRPICLPSFNVDEPHFSNLQFEVSGWGRNGQYSSEIKQLAYLHLADHNQCKRYYPQLTNKHMCAAGQRGADTCKGDSGGPLMVLYRGRYYVSGIVSGKRADSPCGTAVPSLYTNVYHYLDWIMQNIKN